MSLNLTSPAFKLGHPVPLKAPAPMELELANSRALLDELAIAAQLQLAVPNSDLRKAWRQRMNDCRDELGKRLAPKGGL